MKSLSLGKRVKERRKVLGYTAEKLAEKIGVDRTYVSKIERHDYLPSMPIFLQLEDALQLGSEYKQFYLEKTNPFLSTLYGGLQDFGTKSKSPQKQRIHELIVRQVKGLIKEKEWRPGMPLTYLTKPKSDMAFCAELITNFRPSEKDNKKLLRELIDIIKKLRKETEDFQKRFLKIEKKLMDLLKPE